MNELRFDDITPIVEKVHIGGLEYELREMNGDAVVHYENARMERLLRNAEGKVTGTKNIADLTPMLVSLCLFRENQPVPETVIRGWPGRVQDGLSARARSINGMNTPESIEEQIALVQKQLTELQQQLEETKTREQSAKN